MKSTIVTLKQIAARSTNIEQAAEALSRQNKRFSKNAAKQVMLDVKDHLEGTIDETQLSLYLQAHGF